jgi:excisionase family DNA binding protein
MQKQSLTPSPAPAASLLYSVTDACTALGGMGRTWLYDQIKAGRIRTVKLGTRTLIPASEIERMVTDAVSGDGA